VFLEAAALAAVLVVAAVLRLWRLGAVGFNSDEAVYAGTAASMAGHTELQGMFPVFRAHPLLFQILVSLPFVDPTDDTSARAVAAVVGLVAVVTTWLLGRRLYGPVAGVVAALLVAVMPYHVIVSRQVLLDGLVVPFALLCLYCVARYSEETSTRWLVAAGAALGLAVLSKETSLVLLAGLYVFAATTPSVRMRLRDVVAALSVTCVVGLAFPLVVRLSGASRAGNSYFLWQLSRRSNHETTFYLSVVPPAVGPAVLVAGAAGLVCLRRRGDSWRERLLVWWVVAPFAFYSVWPVKGYQYLVPVAPVLAILAARPVAHLLTMPRKDLGHGMSGRLGGALRGRPAAAALAVTLVATLVPSTSAIVVAGARGTFLAGAGGVPGGREAGHWVLANVPAGSELLAVGPSMANILQFYGRRRVYGLSVSPDPHARNPAYVPVDNPDRWIREGRVQYLVWDSYSARRTPFFTSSLMRLVERYNGVAVHTSPVKVDDPSGTPVPVPAVVVYQVWATS